MENQVPTEAELLEAMKIIKAYCIARDDEDLDVDLCYGCPMNPNCGLEACSWKISEVTDG